MFLLQPLIRAIICLLLKMDRVFLLGTYLKSAPAPNFLIHLLFICLHCLIPWYFLAYSRDLDTQKARFFDRIIYHDDEYQLIKVLTQNKEFEDLVIHLGFNFNGGLLFK